MNHADITSQNKSLPPKGHHKPIRCRPGRDLVLAGSMVFHGDLGSEEGLYCDEQFDFLDVNPFIIRVAQGCCWSECGNCPGGGEALRPEELAAELAVHLDPKLYDAFLEIAAHAAAELPDPEDRAYWEAVYLALSQ